MNMVRPGALIFGLRGFHIGTLPVECCVTFESRISQIHQVKTGEGVGYDYLWRAPQDTRVGTMPFGYADGYPRNMRDKGYVTIHGVKCAILGVICMDQVVVDLTNVPQAQVGDVGVIYGSGENQMTIQEASELASTNKNEIVARILSRPPRVYVK
jgi:alanine racemase